MAGVVAAELSLWSARPAELEAQAIAARSLRDRDPGAAQRTRSASIAQAGTGPGLSRATSQRTCGRQGGWRAPRSRDRRHARRGARAQGPSLPRATRRRAAVAPATSPPCSPLPAIGASDWSARPVRPAERAAAEAAAGRPPRPVPSGWEVTFSPRSCAARGCARPAWRADLPGAGGRCGRTMDDGACPRSWRLQPHRPRRRPPRGPRRSRMKSTLVTHAWPHVGGRSRWAAPAGAWAAGTGSVSARRGRATWLAGAGRASASSAPTTGAQRSGTYRPDTPCSVAPLPSARSPLRDPLASIIGRRPRDHDRFCA